MEEVRRCVVNRNTPSCVNWMDYSARKILRTVHELGLTENTFVIFLSGKSRGEGTTSPYRLHSLATTCSVDNGPYLEEGDEVGSQGGLRGGKGQVQLPSELCYDLSRRLGASCQIS